MVPLSLVDGDPAAAAGHHHQPSLYHITDGLDLNDRLRSGRGDHPAVFFFGHESTDGLGRVLERLIIRVHLDLSKHGGHALLDAAVQQFFPQRVLQVITDVALAHGHAYGQRTGNVLLRLGAGQLGHGLLDHAHLGAVSVGDDDLMSFFNQVDDGFGSLLYGDHLLREIAAQSIAAQRDHNTLTHEKNTSICLESIHFGAKTAMDAPLCGAAGENEGARPHRYRQVDLCGRASEMEREYQAESLWGSDGSEKAYFWNQRAIPRSSRAFRVAWGSFTLARKIIAAMM